MYTHTYLSWKVEPKHLIYISYVCNICIHTSGASVYTPVDMCVCTCEMEAAMKASGCHDKWPAKLLITLSGVSRMAFKTVKRADSPSVHLPQAFSSSGTRLCQCQYASGMGFIDREILHQGNGAADEST